MKARIVYLVVALALVFSLVPVMAAPVAAAGTTWDVYPGESIQDAINGAAPGDTVVLHEGKYTENLYIYKSLTLMAAPGECVELDGPANGITIGGWGRVTVEGLEIYGFDVGIYIENIQHGGSITILDCFIHDNINGIWGDNLDGLLTIDGNIISQNGVDLTGVHLLNVGGQMTGGTVVITDNVIGAWYDGEVTWWGNSGDGILIDHIWPMSAVTIGGLPVEEKGNIIADNADDGIDVDKVDGILTIVGNIIGGWDFDLINEMPLGGGEGVSPDPGRVWGNWSDGIDIHITSPGSSVVIQENAIHENGACSDGIYMKWTNGTVDILDNIIGAWTYYELIEVTLYSQYFGGNLNDGIYIDDVDGTVLIDGNKIAENGGGYSGIHIENIERECDSGCTFGSVTISNNDVGEWTDDYQMTYWGNAGHGIYVGWIDGGCTLMIGPNNNVIGNYDDGIEIYNTHEPFTAVTVDQNYVAYNYMYGIELGTPCEVDGATISWNTVIGHYIGIYLTSESDHNAVINNTVTYSYIGIQVDSQAHHNGIVGNYIADNGHGIWVYGWQNDILSNVISCNSAEADSGVHFGPEAFDNVLNHNNITDNGDPNYGSFGVFNENTNVMVDARWNWWGDATGPYHGGTNPDGLGDSVSSFVNYAPWATSAFPYTAMPYDTTAASIMTAVAMPDMISVYTAIEEWTEDWWLAPIFEYEEEFGFTPGPGESNYLVETTDILEDGAAPRGIRYVTLDLMGAIEQFMGVNDLSQVQPPEWVKPWNQEEWLCQWHSFLREVEQWEQMEFFKECTRQVWYRPAAIRFVAASLYWLYFDWTAGYSKLTEMMEPGEIQIGVTVQDWSGNISRDTIDLAVVDVAVPLEQGWNLRSTPIDLGVNCWGDITDLGDGLEYAIAYRFDSETQKWEQLIDTSTLSPLEGIAIKATNRDSLGLVFNRNATPPPTEEVNEGWNLVSLAVGPPYDPYMPVDDALISIEEIQDGVRGYIIANSPRQYVDYHEQWLWCGEYELADYHWYFGQEGWQYLHPGDEAVEPVPNMSIGGAYWVFMERDDTLAGFSSTPVFLRLLVEQGQDLPDVPRYPATTMVFNVDWTDEWPFWYELPPYAGFAGTQWQALVYKGAFAPEDVLTYYENELPDLGWQMGSKFIVNIDEEFYPECMSPIYFGDAIGIGFWKEGEEATHGGVPYYTDTLRILAFEVEEIAFVAMFYAPVDVPTMPGTNLILWESAWPGDIMYMEYQGAIIDPSDPGPDLDYAIAYYTEAMAALQWELDGCDCGEGCTLYFWKPWIAPWGQPLELWCNITIYYCPVVDAAVIEVYRSSFPLMGP